MGNFEEKDYYTAPELAKVLGLSHVAVFNKIKKGEIKARKIGRNFAIAKDEFASLANKSLSERQKVSIEQAVRQAMKDYGPALKKLGET